MWVEPITQDKIIIKYSHKFIISMTKTTFLIMAIFALTLTLTLGVTSVFAATNTLPGGTNIEVTIDTPPDTDAIEITTGTTVDVPVVGRSEIGMGNALKDTDVIYVLDVSGSMNLFSRVDCDGDGNIEPNTSSTAGDDQRIDCAIEGIKAANAAASETFSSISKTGLATFNASGAVWDLDLGTAGNQLLVVPNTDGDGNSLADLIDVVSSLQPVGGTSYGDGLTALNTIISESTSPNKLVIFISDGENNQLPRVIDFTTTFDNNGVIFKAFAVGDVSSGVRCNTSSSYGDLDDVANLTPGGSCQNITDMSTLGNVIKDSIGATLEKLEIDVDNTGRTLIDNSEITPDLPVMGPAMADYTTTISSMGAGLHNICVIATGSTAFGLGEVRECVDITIFDAPPTLTVPTIAPTEATGPLGTVVSFTVTATDIVDGPLTPTCNATSGDVFPIGTTTVTCSVTDSATNTVDSFFDIVVEDTTPPVLTVPGDIVETTGDPSGSSITFVATATDIVDGNVVPICTPSSGDVFPVGTTTVTCSATDSRGNTSVDSFFDVTVELDIQGQKLSAIVMLESLKTGDEKSDKKVDKVIKHIVKSTDEKFWADDGNSLDDKKSKKVFDEEKKAVKGLKKLIKDADDSLQDSILHVVGLLIDVDRNLSESAMAEASAFAGDKKVDDELEKAQEELNKAQEELNKAQEELDDDNPDKALDKYAKAIDHFKKAWEHAQKAIKHATK